MKMTRVYNLAKELGLTSKQLQNTLAMLGVTTRSPSSILEPTLVETIKFFLGDGK